MTALLLVAQLATATTCTTVQPSPAFVCVNGGWLPPGHPDIPLAEAPLPAHEPGEETCRGVNPYTDPEWAAICAAWSQDRAPRPHGPTFQVGVSYRNPYGFTMVVLSLATSLERVPVVTAQYTSHHLIGRIFAFRIDQPTSPWQEVRP